MTANVLLLELIYYNLQMNVSNLNVLNYLPQNPNKFYTKEEDNPLELFSNDNQIEDGDDDVNEFYNSQTSYN